MSSENRRKFQRILFDAGASIEGPSGLIPVQLVDISLNGVLIKRPEGWSASVGDEVTFLIQLDTEHEFDIRMHTRMAHTHHDMAGLHCEHIDIDSITYLRRLVELNLGDADILERELVALG